MQFYVSQSTSYFFLYVYSISIFLLAEQEGPARNATLVKERVKLVPMKKGKVLVFKRGGVFV